MKSEKVSSSMAVKIKNAFFSPLTNRLVKTDSEINVPKNRFWYKRIQDGDCVAIKKVSKVLIDKSDSPKSGAKSGKKGSK